MKAKKIWFCAGGLLAAAALAVGDIFYGRPDTNQGGSKRLRLNRGRIERNRRPLLTGHRRAVHPPAPPGRKTAEESISRLRRSCASRGTIALPSTSDRAAR